MTLREIARTIRANWVFALLAFAVCIVAGAAYATLPAKQYKATVILVAQPPAGSVDPGSDVSAIQVEIPQIVVEVGTSLIKDEAKALVPARFRSVPATITATGDPSSNSVTISATTTDPAASQAYANATAARVIRVTNADARTVLTLSELGTAPLPTSPTNARTTVALAAIAFGLIAAVFAALAAAALKRPFVTADEVRDKLGVRVLTEVPKLAQPRSGLAAMFEFGSDPRGLEAFQRLRSTLHLMFQDVYPTIAVTSCDPSEGKSSVTSHVAWALATKDRSVVAVDCDLRKPTLHTIFSVPLSPGVSDLSIHDQAEVEGLMVKSGNSYMDVIPAGVPRLHPTDVAAHDVPLLLNALHESERMVIMDCPPLTGAAETVILVSKADAVVLVVDARRFSPERIERSLAQLRAAGAKEVGIVLNRVRRRRFVGEYNYYSTVHMPPPRTSRSRRVPPAKSPDPERSGSMRLD
jgi:succinoglycan biosynthesis transport protein ExoP